MKTADVRYYLLILICFSVLCFSFIAIFSGCSDDDGLPPKNGAASSSSPASSPPSSSARHPSPPEPSSLSQSSRSLQSSELMPGASSCVVSADIQGEWPFLNNGEPGNTGIAENLLTRNFLLIFDSSGSMGETGCGDGRKKIDVAKEAVTQWANTIPDDANLGLVAFYHNMWAELDLAPASVQKTLFTSQINKVWASAGTPLTEAVERAYAKLTDAGRKQLGYGDYTIVVVTDGIANSRAALKTAVKKVLDQSPVDIYTIGFCIGEHHSLNQPGKTTYRSADNPEALKEGLSRVLAESDFFDEKDFHNE